MKILFASFINFKNSLQYFYLLTYQWKLSAAVKKEFLDKYYRGQVIKVVSKSQIARIKQTMSWWMQIKWNKKRISRLGEIKLRKPHCKASFLQKQQRSKETETKVMTEGTMDMVFNTSKQSHIFFQADAL